MRTAMEQAAQAYPNVEMDIYTGDLEDGQAIVQQMPPNSYDCIISRGGTAALIRQVTDLRWWTSTSRCTTCCAP